MATDDSPNGFTTALELRKNRLDRRAPDCEYCPDGEAAAVVEGECVCGRCALFLETWAVGGGPR
jgi:hypothetical protein